MTDLELIQLVTGEMDAAIAARGWDFIVLQKDQPTQQGQPTGGVVYFEMLPDLHHGFAYSQLEYKADVDKFDDREVQQVETTFQISASIPQKPEDLSIPTPSDVLTQVKMWLSHRATQAKFNQQKVGVLRARDIRKPFIVNGEVQFEMLPNFDITFTHNRSLAIEVPAVHTCEPGTVEDVSGAGTFPVLD